MAWGRDLRRRAGLRGGRQAEVGFDVRGGGGVGVAGGAVAERAVAPGSVTTVQYWGSAAYDAGGCPRFSAQVRVRPPAGSWYAPPVYGFGFALGAGAAAAAESAASVAEPREDERDGGGAGGSVSA